MKKLIIASFLILFGMSTMAQGFRLGVKAGADMNKMQAIGFADGFTFGYHAGAFAELKLSQKLGLQPEVYFSQHNLDTADQFSDIYNDLNVSNISLKYLNIPILLTYRLSKGFALQAGPQFGILMSQGGLVKNGENAFKSGDFSMVGGIQLSLGSINIYGRYVVGLSDVQNIDLGNTFDNSTWQSQTIHLGLGLTLF